MPVDDLLDDRPPWLDGRTPPEPEPLPERADVVVAGAGLAGLELARVLAGHGASVVVLEARDQVGHGTAGRDPGVITGGLPEHPWRLVEAIGADKTRVLYDLSDRSLARIQELVGKLDPALHAAIDEREVQELHKSAQALDALGQRVDSLNATATCEAIGGEGFTAGLRVHGEGATGTESLVVALLEQTRQAGVHVAVQAPVERIEQETQGQRVHTPRGAVRADVVVLCAGHRAGGVLPWLGDKVVPVREHALRLHGVSARPARAQYGYITWRPDAQGGLRISGCRWATQHLEVYETVEQPRQVVLDKILGFAGRNLGAADEPRITHRWARILTATCDGLPILGPLPGDPTIVLCTGFQGFAPALALACAHDVAHGLQTGHSPLPAWMSPQRFL